MKALSPEDRPREKLLRLGPTALGDNELVALVLGHGYRAVHALELATDVLATLGGVHGLTRTSVRELARHRGLGPSSASRLVAGIELGRRTLSQSPPRRAPLASPREVAAYLLPRFGGGEVEQVGVLLLDARHRLLHARVLTRGTVDASPVHPRDVFREATVAGAAAVVVFHNHPSGDPTPSGEDVALTRRLCRAGELMGIDVIDHVILAGSAYCSMREIGLVPGH
jgi:DNA repair protein RadC